MADGKSNQGWEQVGKQRFRRQSGHLLVQFLGEYSLDEAKVMQPSFAELWRANPQAIVLFDCTLSNYVMSSAVRRYIAEFGQQHFTPENHSIIIGTTLLVRTSTKMVMAFASITGQKQGTVHFVNTEAEGWELARRLTGEPNK